MTPEELARTFDHTLLRPDAGEADVRTLAAEVREHGFRGLCVAPCWVELGRELLADSAAHLVSIVGFPLGSESTAVKAVQARDLVRHGADEVDMVMNVGWLKEGHRERIENEVRTVVEAADGKAVKVIIETCLLTEDEKQLATNLAVAGGAAFVKTSTGFSTGGAEAEDVKLIAAEVPSHVRVKASAGIRTLHQALALLDAGAHVLGCSASVSILEEFTTREKNGKP